ncbi:MAG: aspartate kinase [Armatimonadetes bacterium]|nr:aspartate kinase [Armatimonadota bacterium]
MKIVVQKFGGTSVDTHEHRLMACRKVIQAKEGGVAPVVVVSAIGRGGAPYATDTLIRMLLDVDPNTRPDTREMDLMMACGEIISTVLMAHTLKTLGYPAVALTGGQAGIMTDADFGNALILSIDPQRVVQVLEQGKIAVVCGFQGVSMPEDKHSHGDITTLGRGGSDTTGSALGAALRADSVEIYTDVNGVLTADPKAVPGARSLPTITYEEIAEMAHQGAKVLHPRAAEIAMNHKIPLWVKSTTQDLPGTLITTREAASSGKGLSVTGITHLSKVAYITLTIAKTEDKPRIELEIYKLMAKLGINVYLVSVSPDTISFVITRDHLRKVRDTLNGLVLPVPSAGEKGRLYVFDFGETTTFRLQREMLERVGGAFEAIPVPTEVAENCAVISVIAENLDVPGVMADVVETLYGAEVDILQTADSDLSISCLVHDSDAEQAVRALHRRFVEG